MMCLSDKVKRLLVKNVRGRVKYKGHGFFDSKEEIYRKVCPELLDRPFTVYIVTNDDGKDFYGGLPDYHRFPDVGDTVTMSLVRFSRFYSSRISTDKYIGHRKKVLWRKVEKMTLLDE